MVLILDVYLQGYFLLQVEVYPGRISFNGSLLWEIIDTDTTEDKLMNASRITSSCYCLANMACD